MANLLLFIAGWLLAAGIAWLVASAMVLHHQKTCTVYCQRQPRRQTVQRQILTKIIFTTFWPLFLLLCALFTAEIAHHEDGR